MHSRDTFFRFIRPEHLYLTALSFIVVTSILVSAIYIYLYVKKKRHFLKQFITDKLDEYISTILIGEEILPDQLLLDEELTDILNRKSGQQLAIDQLINTKKNLTGHAAESIIELYEKLNLKTISIQKFRSPLWYKKAKGIYELYMMNQKSLEKQIAQYTNSNNEYVRTEAQTAIIGFSGFHGLSFLGTLSYPLTDWQQIKLLEQLQLLNPDKMPDLPLWLQSTNQYVVAFALKLAETYQQMHVHTEVVHCLNSPSERIRHQAILTLSRIAQDDTTQILKTIYAQETYANKQTILKQIAIIGTDDDIDFLINVLKTETNDTLKLEAVRATMKSSLDGDKIIAEVASENQVIAVMAKQINYEMTK
ncbi:MAG: HEAT repeat domain-containing protein [Bacteroidetes bacterium]|nr:HEAT repeat domain-containing protein [Bacteroidota bacterium]